MRVLAMALLLVAVATGCGASDEQSAPSQSTTVSEPRGSNTTRKDAPAIAGESLDGETIALGDLRGRPVLVNVWSSW